MKTTLNEMLFPVQKSLITERSKIKTLASNAYGIYGDIDRNGDPYLLNTCTAIYELLPNEELFPRIEQILNDANIPFSVQYRMIDHTRFYADYAIKTGAIKIGDNGKDEIYPLIRVEHSYNGLLSYKMYFGYFRMICTNGLVIPVAEKETTNLVVKGKHTKKILESLKSLIDKIEYFTILQDTLVQPFQVMADTWVPNWEERVLEVATATAVGLRGVKAIFEKDEETKKLTDNILGYEGQILDVIEKEAKLLGNGKVNEWLIYNGFNYHIFNATTKATDGKEGREYDTAYELRVDQDKKVLKEILSAHN